MPVDYVVVGAGFFGSAFSRRVAEAGRTVLLVDRRRHIGGNCYSENVAGVEVHKYGPHIFHTQDRDIWQFVNRFSRFNSYRHRGVVRSRGRMFSFPINLQTLNQLWGVKTPAEAEQALAAVREPFPSSQTTPPNLEQWVLAQVGREIYETFIEGYTTKQWGRPPKQLPSAIIRRLPIRLSWDDNYFSDHYQGIPEQGYTRLFENLLDHPNIKVTTGVDFFSNRHELESIGSHLVYTGKIDEYFDYRYGRLEYKSLRFESEVVSGDFQGAAVVNYTDSEIPYTRIVEHKHFAQQECKTSVVTREYPQAYQTGGEAFYPVGDDKNRSLYQRYRTLAKMTTPNTLFGGRLGTYQYFDMHQVIAQALHLADAEIAAAGRSNSNLKRARSAA